jgi:hypothetical protein
MHIIIQAIYNALQPHLAPTPLKLKNPTKTSITIEDQNHEITWIWYLTDINQIIIDPNLPSYSHRRTILHPADPKLIETLIRIIAQHHQTSTDLETNPIVRVQIPTPTIKST